MAQDLPFRSIPNAPENLTTENTISRMIEGLGFRYYWATEALCSEDLTYRPSETGQSFQQTLEHIYGLSEVILNTAKNVPSIRPARSVPKDFNTIRTETLHQLRDAAERFQDLKTADLNSIEVIFERGGEQQHFPLWNLINGPISDAIYHTGQLVSFRRSAGNPIPKGVNVFLGKKM